MPNYVTNFNILGENVKIRDEESPHNYESLEAVIEVFNKLDINAMILINNQQYIIEDTPAISVYSNNNKYLNYVDDTILVSGLFIDAINEITTFSEHLINKTIIVDKNINISESFLFPEYIDLKCEKNCYLIGDGYYIDVNNNSNININVKTLSTPSRVDGIITSQLAVAVRVSNKSNSNITVKGDGVVITLEDSTNINISNCDLNSGYDAMACIALYRCNNVTIQNSNIYGCNFNSIGVNTCENIKVLNNKLHKNGHSGIYTPYSTNLLIQNNMCYNNKYDGIDCNFGADNLNFDFKCKSIISDNICYDNDATGIYVCGSEFKVINNNCYHNGTNGIRIKSWKTESSNSINNVLSNNNVYDNVQKNSPKGSSLTHNILMENIQNTIVDGNIVYFTQNISNRENNMFLSSMKNSTISNNICYDIFDQNRLTLGVFADSSVIFLGNYSNINQELTSLKTINSDDITINNTLVINKEVIYQPGSSIPTIPRNSLAWATNGAGVYFLLFQTDHDGLKVIQLNNSQ